MTARTHYLVKRNGRPAYVHDLTPEELRHFASDGWKEFTPEQIDQALLEWHKDWGTRASDIVYNTHPEEIAYNRHTRQWDIAHAREGSST